MYTIHLLCVGKNEEQEAISPLVDKAFIEKSAKDFADSIKSGDLYRELRGEGKRD
ncbi:MAG: hypothetical protein IPH52_08870 [Leptospiraceae bacterium]|nr:hypothetical protein [Leptospiraceae bacterium]MBK7055152.1 hypothetical protein [Leptospiraceae bacterium]